MKKIIVLLSIGIFPLLSFSQQDCSLEEYALLQDKPQDISNMSALSVIQGRTKYAGVQSGNSTFYHSQTFPYPKDSATNFQKGWTVAGSTGSRHWEYKKWVSGTEAPSLNRTMIFFLMVFLFFSFIHGISNGFWDMSDFRNFKMIKRPQSWKDFGYSLLEVLETVMKVLLSGFILFPALIAFMLTAAGWIIMSSIGKSLENFGFSDFLLRGSAFLLTIYIGAIIGAGVRYLRSKMIQKNFDTAVPV